MFHLSWYVNHDRLDVAATANRLAAAGVPVWRALAAAPGIEAGDYLFEGSPALAAALGRCGLAVDDAAPRPARLRLRAGQRTGDCRRHSGRREPARAAGRFLELDARQEGRHRRR